MQPFPVHVARDPGLHHSLYPMKCHLNPAHHSDHIKNNRNQDQDQDSQHKQFYFKGISNHFLCSFAISVCSISTSLVSVVLIRSINSATRLLFSSTRWMTQSASSVETPKLCRRQSRSSLRPIKVEPSIDSKSRIE